MKKILFVILIVFLAYPLNAMAKEWKLDPVHSNFFFDIQHIYSTVRGQFGEFTGDIYFTPANPEKSRFNFEIKVSSIDTKEGKRDIHLRSPDFFDAGKYPVITFKSGKVVLADDNRYTVDGTLTIKDVFRDISLEFNYHGQKENPLKPGQMVAGFDSRMTINRLEYHIGDGKFAKMGVVNEDVAILVTLEILRDK
jgi:polyisoprenoid-binding protein YceI